MILRRTMFILRSPRGLIYALDADGELALRDDRTEMRDRVTIQGRGSFHCGLWRPLSHIIVRRTGPGRPALGWGQIARGGLSRGIGSGVAQYLWESARHLKIDI